MRINEILTESQLQQIEEGPKLDAAGRAVGGFVSGAAKGIGALAGGVRGAFTALKKGYQTGKAIVGDDPDPNAGAPGYTAPADKTAAPTPTPVADPKAAPTPVADPKAAPTPVADPKAAPTPAPEPSTTPPSAADINAQGPEGSAPAKPQTGDAGKALAKTDAVTDKQTTTKAGETVYAQVKANIDKLDKKGKQRILQLLTKSLSAPVAPPVKTPAPKPAAADPAAAPAAGAPPAADPGAAAFGQMANTLTKEPTKAATPAADPAAAPAGAPTAPAGAPTAPAADPAAAGGKLTAAQQAAKVAELKGKRAAGKTTGTTGSGFGGYVKKASGERVVGANKDGSVRTVNIKASKDNYGNALSEALALRVEAHKQKMFETGLAHGTTSIFRK